MSAAGVNDDDRNEPVMSSCAVCTAQIFQHQIMKRGAAEVDCGPVTEAADDIRMTHAIESHGFILEVLNQGGLELSILITLKQHIECFNYDYAKSLVRRGSVAGQVNLRIAATPQTVFDVITTVEAALKKL